MCFRIVQQGGIMQKRNLLIGGTGGVLGIAMGLIFGFEGYRTEAYPDTGKVWTICYGETLGVKKGDKATPEQCNNMLMQSLARHNKPFESLPNELPQNVHLAMLDWTYNVGVGAATSSTAWKYLKSGQYDKACAELPKWRFVTVNGKKLDCSIKSNNCSGVWKRRQIEQDICLGKVTPEQALTMLGSKPMDADGATL
jgi:lysozyme